MIIKIKSHKKPTFRKLLEYMMQGSSRLFDSKGNSFVITHNLKGNTITNWEGQFKQNENNRLRKRSDSVYLTHEILSWHKADSENLSLPKLEEMTHEYLRERNPKGMYVAVPHFDKGHYHVHICASGIEYKTGKSLRLSKPELQKLKKDVQNHQQNQYPELNNSLVNHKVKNIHSRSDKEFQLKQRTGRATSKEQILKILNDCYSKASNKETFLKLIKKEGLEPYSRNGKVTGVVYKNLKFRFSRLGFDEKHLDSLSKSTQREQEIGTSRENNKSRRIIRNR